MKITRRQLKRLIKKSVLQESKQDEHCNDSLSSFLASKKSEIEEIIKTEASGLKLILLSTNIKVDDLKHPDIIASFTVKVPSKKVKNRDGTINYGYLRDNLIKQLKDNVSNSFKSLWNDYDKKCSQICFDVSHFGVGDGLFPHGFRITKELCSSIV